MPRHRRLPDAAAGKAPQGNVHHADEPLEQGRHELAKGHQVVLVVPIFCHFPWHPTHHRIAIALRFTPQGHADQGGRRAARLPVGGRDGGQIVRRQLLGQHRNRRFGRHHQRCRFLQQLQPVPLQGPCDAATGDEFFILRNIALQQGHRDRRAPRHGLGLLLHPGRSPPQAQRHCAHAQQHPGALPQRCHLDQRHRQGSSHRTGAVDPQPARPDRQRTLDVGVATRPPGETGPQGATRQFCDGPARGKQQHGAPSGTVRAAPDPGGHGVVTAQEGGQRQDGQHRQGRRQAAIGMHRNEQPPEGAAQPGGGKQPAAPCRLPGTGRVLHRQAQQAE